MLTVFFTNIDVMFSILTAFMSTVILFRAATSLYSARVNQSSTNVASEHILRRYKMVIIGASSAGTLSILWLSSLAQKGQLQFLLP